MENAQTETQKRVMTGTVTSDKMNKTIVVQVSIKRLHPQYGKTIVRSQKFKAHDEKNEAKQGDTVVIQECRPLSKDKRWRLIEIQKGIQS